MNFYISLCILQIPFKGEHKSAFLIYTILFQKKSSEKFFRPNITFLGNVIFPKR
jgi:hypothetical protein